MAAQCRFIFSLYVIRTRSKIVNMMTKLSKTDQTVKTDSHVNISTSRYPVLSSLLSDPNLLQCLERIFSKVPLNFSKEKAYYPFCHRLEDGAALMALLTQKEPMIILLDLASEPDMYYKALRQAMLCMARSGEDFVDDYSSQLEDIRTLLFSAAKISLSVSAAPFPTETQ